MEEQVGGGECMGQDSARYEVGRGGSFCVMCWTGSGSAVQSEGQSRVGPHMKMDIQKRARKANTCGECKPIA